MVVWCSGELAVMVILTSCKQSFNLHLLYPTASKLCLGLPQTSDKICIKGETLQVSGRVG